MKPGPKRTKDTRSSTRGQDRVRMTRLMLERMRTIHRLLSGKTYPSLKKLTESCEVDARTIWRDFEMMRDRMGAEVVWNAKKRGYEYAGEVAALPDILLTEEELRSL